MFKSAIQKSSSGLCTTLLFLSIFTNAAPGQEHGKKIVPMPGSWEELTETKSQKSGLIGQLPSKPDASLEQSTAPQNPNRPIRDKWAIVVGIGSFKDPSIPHLTYARKDAGDFYNYLVKEANFKSDHVRLLLDDKADQRRILSEVGTKFLARLVHPDDLVVLFLSTHGSPSQFDIKGKNFLVAYDSDPTDLFTTGIEMQNIFESVRRRVSTDRIVMILDACHSGATDPSGKGIGRTGNFDAQELAQGSGQLVICSSLPHEQSFESRRYKNGIFTKQLLNGLHVAGPRTTLGTAFQYLEKTVPEEVGIDYPNSTQTPAKRGRWNGNDLILTANASAPRIVPPTVLADLKPDSTQEAIATQDRPKIMAQTMVLPNLPITKTQERQTQANIKTPTTAPTLTPTATSHTPSAATTPLPTTASIFKKKWALVIGLSCYQNPTMNIMYGAKDARDFARYLIEKANFAKENVILLINEQATRSAILDTLVEKLPSQVSPDDLFVFFQSGHVSPPELGNALIAYDTDCNRLYSTAISLRDINAAISQRLKSQRNLLIMESQDITTPETTSHPGNTFSATTDIRISSKSLLPPYYYNQGKGTVFLTATQTGQRSWESKRYQNGVFTRQLIQGLLSKGENTSISEAILYARENTDKEVWEDRKVHQTPVVLSKWKGIELHPAIKLPDQ